MPGLINMHEHLGVVHPDTHEQDDLAGETPEQCFRRMAENAVNALRAGVTSMRLAGERDGLDLALRVWLESHDVAAPRIWTAARPLDYTGGGRWFVGAVECASAEEFGLRAQEQVERGADFLKVMLTGGAAGPDPGAIGVSAAEFDAIRQVALSAGVRIAVHTAAVESPIHDMLVDDGGSLEHCYLMDEHLLHRCVERSTLLVLTPLVGRSPAYLEELGLSRDAIERMTRTGDRHWKTVCAAVEGGARIALGTDLHSHVTIDGTCAAVRELELYEEAGAPPEVLLAIASTNGADWLGVGDRLGLVEVGYEADLLLLASNPFQTGAAAFRGMRGVISRGRMIGPNEVTRALAVASSSPVPVLNSDT